MRAVEVSSADRLLKKPFRIAGEEHFDVTTVTVSITEDGHTGRGECNPYSVLGWTKDRVLAEIERVRPALAVGADRVALLDLVPPGPARNALDCALVDLECRTLGQTAGEIFGIDATGPVVSAMTLDIGANAAGAVDLPVVKIKIDDASDPSVLAELRRVAPTATVLVDANGSLDEDGLRQWLPHLVEHGVSVLEQPMPRGCDDGLIDVKSEVLLCADESFQTARDLHDCAGRYDLVNIKLDKIGGLTAAVGAEAVARGMGLGTMVGCMMGTSLSAAPAWWLAQRARFIDLDGPTLLAEDMDNAMTWTVGAISRPDVRLWG
ncbi:L-alanine-DL-glutamate epimerase [Actinopolyspora xinjiangensis]|uniref:Dipeptide epimerase n=1 Tax=Actinopolyspora xinjiangensis TaxID=405564 RepID=A0A1H0X1U5_9ACTN|nr:dipeptide epimerase [Actinopolyspora xinjiangensis]SDP96927.1 L-alanine-DL-glutamate epimerase [Actinopolyspora xinjiangensis]